MEQTKKTKKQITPLLIMALLISSGFIMSQTEAEQSAATPYPTVRTEVEVELRLRNTVPLEDLPEELLWAADDVQKLEYQNRKPISRVIRHDCDPNHLGCAKLKEASEFIDPYNIEYKPFLNFPTRVAYQAPELIQETGYMNLKDGDAKYWWVSHHGEAQTSLLYVKMSDGSEMFMEGGGACCEARVSGKTLSDLKNYLLIYDDSNLARIQQEVQSSN